MELTWPELYITMSGHHYMNFYNEINKISYLLQPWDDINKNYIHNMMLSLTYFSVHGNFSCLSCEN